MSENQCHNSLPAPSEVELEITKDLSTPASAGTAIPDSAESGERVARFICPECGGHDLDQWIIGLRISCQVVGVTPSGRLLCDYSTESAEGNGEIAYTCRNCDFDIPYGQAEDDLEGEEEYFVAQRLIQNCGLSTNHEPPESLEPDEGPMTLAFTCSQCGGHKLEAVRLDTCEVTPVEYATDEPVLVFGTMRYSGGTHFFQCPDCESKLGPHFDDPESLGNYLVSWIAENPSRE